MFITTINKTFHFILVKLLSFEFPLNDPYTLKFYKLIPTFSVSNQRMESS